ncbi:MAG: NTP transferase domain-containing protein [Desulfobacterales bacterium]|jgi:UDP-N-acetylglucosamine diphosphorylase/glucosamine-1-phosphate N-acetyltransferase|nr:NTP transferase domain-containing protein [Desulfobacterales bacterium]|tara:strand:- start:1057 stop:1836 length:780 start_codon:yes stop_codon:yes gene_type:complete
MDCNTIRKTDKNVAVIILAAGLGMRMESRKAKVLHELHGRPMVMYVVETAEKCVKDNIVLVIGNQAETVRKIVSKHSRASFAIQDAPLGTGDAVLSALPYLSDDIEQVVILCGDVPLITADTVLGLINDHVSARRDITVLGSQIDNPKGYGRILFDENRHVFGIVEESEATKQQKRIKTINSGTYCVKKDFLFDSLKKIMPDNVKGEFYLTDIIGIGYRGGKNIGVLIGSNNNEILGINTRQDLKQVENMIKNRPNKKS